MPAALALLAATLPMPSQLLEAAAVEVADAPFTGQISRECLARLFVRLGVEVRSGPQRPRRPRRLPSNYSLKTRAARRLRWLVLKCAGAVGAALRGGALGILIGLVLGVVAAWEPGEDYNDNDWDTHAGNVQEEVLKVLIALLIMLLVWLWRQLWRRLNPGVKPKVLVLRGIQLGSALGAIIGWLHALSVINPDRHVVNPIRSVFLAGLLGERMSRGTQFTRRAVSLKRVDVFNASDIEAPTAGDLTDIGTQ